MREYFDLFWIFFKMSAVTFGGGYAMLPILQREIAEKKGFMTQEQIVDYYAVSQGLPGIIAVNVSIFIGKDRKGVLGGIACALGVVAPCLIIIAAIAAALENFQELLVVRHAFSGITLCVAALILDAVIGLWKKAIDTTFSIILFLIVFISMAFLNLSPLILILTSALLGILYKGVRL